MNHKTATTKKPLANRNMTRDPFHPMAGSTYVKNMRDLKITLNGKLLDSQLIVSVYQVTQNRAPYVTLFSKDPTTGKIRTDPRTRKAMTYDMEGEIDIVDGVPYHCACWRKRRVANWWTRIDRNYAGW